MKWDLISIKTEIVMYNSMDIINSQLDFDFSPFNTPALTAVQGYSYLHDLAIAELVERGLDMAKLAKADLS